MMRSKPSSKNSINHALLFNLLLLPYLFCGCSGRIESTYKENEIPQIVKKICKEEYKLDVFTQRANTTLWIYAPVEKILHKDYGTDKEKVFDEELLEKLRNILTTVGRVLISSDKAPEFYGLVASDINAGIDYIIVGNVLDIKKSYSGFIPWTEANRRYVIRLKMAPEAVGDSTGKHIEAYDIQLPEFLAEQIAQRVGAQFQGEDLKKYFQIEKSEGSFKAGRFIFEYSMKQVLPAPASLDPKEKIIDTITYCIRSYGFKDFSEVELSDLLTKAKLNLSRGAILARALPN